jgi:hypothetical protein
MAVLAYGMYESVYQVYARYSMMTKTSEVLEAIFSLDKEHLTDTENLKLVARRISIGRYDTKALGHTSLRKTKAPTNMRPIDARKTIEATTLTGLNICCIGGKGRICESQPTRSPALQMMQATYQLELPEELDGEKLIKPNQQKGLGRAEDSRR